MLISFMTWREWGKRRRQQCEVQREGDLVVQSETIVFLWRTTGTTDGSLVFGERKAEQEQHTKKLIFLSRLGGLNITLSHCEGFRIGAVDIEKLTKFLFLQY